MITEILNFENRLQGYKTRVKELHFSANRHSIHIILDDFEGELSEFEDEIMEELQAIHGQYTPGEINPVLPKSLDSDSLLREIRADLINMREFLDRQPMYSGSVSVLDDFLHNVNKTIYLIRLSLEG
jgi:hypothetical protein